MLAHPHSHTHTSTNAHMCIHLCMCLQFRDLELALGIFQNLPPPPLTFLDSVSHWTQSSPLLARLTGLVCLVDSPVYISPALGLQMCLPCLDIVTVPGVRAQVLFLVWQVLNCLSHLPCPSKSLGLETPQLIDILVICSGNHEAHFLKHDVLLWRNSVIIALD